MKLTIYRGKESKTIPAIDYGEGYIRQGWALERQPEPTPAPSSPESESTPPVLDALVLLNTATTISELEPLPSVGKAIARTLLSRRPDDGYASLDNAAELNADKTTIDWEAIALWNT